MYKIAIIPSVYLGNKMNELVLPSPASRFLGVYHKYKNLILHLSHHNPHKNCHYFEFYNQN